jgi:hypothetical protein
MGEQTARRRLDSAGVFAKENTFSAGYNILEISHGSPLAKT